MKNYKYLIPLHQWPLISQEYLSGQSLRSLSVKYQTTPKTLSKIVKRQGGKVVNRGARKYTLNHDYFEIIDSEDKAYILGFLYADGTVGKDASNVTISLIASDKAILEKMKCRLNYTGPLLHIPSKNLHVKGKIYKASAQWRLSVSSQKLHHDLLALGMCPNKSAKIRMPFDKIPANLLIHFVRGYFDGDGGIKKYLAFSKKTPSYQVAIASNIVFCGQLQRYLNSTFDANCKVSRRSDNYGYLVCGGNKQVERLLDIFYRDSSIFLERKHSKYLEIKNR